jgi:elongation factor 1-beta
VCQYSHIAVVLTKCSSQTSRGIVGTGVETPAAKAAAAGGDDDDIDLFGSDDEVDEEAERIKAERVAEYNKKKAAKGPRAAAKSVVTLEVKPWDDETDMKELEKGVRAVEMDGLVWGSSKLVPVGYGVSKLQITLVVEDDKVSLDDLQEQIAEVSR